MTPGAKSPNWGTDSSIRDGLGDCVEGLKCFVDLCKAIRTGEVCLHVAGLSSDLYDFMTRRCESDPYFLAQSP